MSNSETHTMEIKSQEQLILEMHEDMRKAKNYMKWQLIITVSLVVIPLLASLLIIPFTLRSLSTAYGGGAESTGTGERATKLPGGAGQLMELLQ